LLGTSRRRPGHSAGGATARLGGAVEGPRTKLRLPPSRTRPTTAGIRRKLRLKRQTACSHHVAVDPWSLPIAHQTGRRVAEDNSFVDQLPRSARSTWPCLTHY
jgi:hypothetical protein